MKVVLPFGDAFIKQNPKETLMFSILSANNTYEDLLESFWDSIGYGFEDNNLQYYDAHILGEFRSLNHIIKKVEDIHSSKFIQFVEESLRQKYYILSILDWNEMECFKLQGAKYFPHEVAIFGFDNKEETVYVSDFL